MSPSKSLQSSAESHHQTADNHYDDHQLSHQQKEQQQDEQSLASSILEGISTLKKRKSLTVYVSPKSQQAKQQPDTKLIQKQQHAAQANVVMPLTKRHYTKHKYNTTQRQTQMQTQMQTQNQISQPVSTSSHTALTNILTSTSTSSKSKQKIDKKQMPTNQQPLSATCSNLPQSFVMPAVPSVTATVISCNVNTPTAMTTATATTCTSTVPSITLTNTALASSSSSGTTIMPTAVAVASSIVSNAGPSDKCLEGGSAESSSTTAACTSAVQQLRLFRRYSYNVNVSYTACLRLLNSI